MPSLRSEIGAVYMYINIRAHGVAVDNCGIKLTDVSWQFNAILLRDPRPSLYQPYLSELICMYNMDQSFQSD
jgi:hypothetical protein